MSYQQECSVSVWRGYGLSRSCGRKAKGELSDGKPACGVHLRAEAARKERDRVIAQKMRMQKEALGDAQRVVDALALLGVEATASSRGTGQVVLSVATAERVVERLRDARD